MIISYQLLLIVNVINGLPTYNVWGPQSTCHQLHLAGHLHPNLLPGSGRGLSKVRKLVEMELPQAIGIIWNHFASIRFNSLHFASIRFNHTNKSYE